MEKKAFKRAYYHVRNEDAALDILQDSMIKLCTNYADKPVAELPLFTNLSDFNSGDGDGDFDLLEVTANTSGDASSESAEQWVDRLQTLEHIETAVMALPVIRNVTPRIRTARDRRGLEE